MQTHRAEAPESEGGCHSPTLLAAKLGTWAARRLASSLKPVGLRPRHLAMLVQLRRNPLSQQGLRDAVGIDAAQLVGLLNELESEGLVVRRRDPGDRRRHIVEISALGCQRLALADRALAEIDAGLTEGLAPAERSQLAALLAFVLEHGAYDEACDGEPELALAAGDGDCPSTRLGSGSSP
jgi:DNA-binding MarR family transcriptional regulator